MSMKFDRIVLEGTDKIGKTTIVENLKYLGFDVSDRSINISKNVKLPHNLTNENIENIKNEIINNSITLYVFIVYKDNKVAEQIKGIIDKSDKYDKDFDKYNQSYLKIVEKLNDFDNVLILERKVDTTPYELVVEIIKKYLEDLKIEELPITIEGESKIYRKVYNLNIAVATLKPSVYSFTFKRYSIVEGTDVARNGIWEIIGSKLNISYNRFKFHNENYIVRLLNYYANGLMKFKKDIFVSNFLFKINDNTSLVVFENQIPNIEVVWKRKHVGTPKHKLIGVEKFKTRYGKVIKPEGLYPNPVIRFDWRNPVEHDEKTGELIDKGDEAIADEFADFYIDTQHSKILTNYVSWWLFHYFDSYGLELVDLCYFQNENADRIHSEITPDGMRLKLKDEHKDMDKDLWRKGADKSVLKDRWMELLNIIKNS